ncbi:hypothetical protein COCVIDRAFT_20702 [Bipolaris victoriae FI3]|uniref:C2H2-type domain-containing protein n=1 Tax=Bipolaris victoriae (strain FI3) TaxID=930091 RepID=W7E5U3_BIPV3|nr:hypothetical protein COCVIDRAFT_20702 [Bipolaris victoriae FI3]
MAQASADASSLTIQPDSFENQLRQDSVVIHPNSNRNYQCQRCLKSFPCHEPYLYHASKHGDTIEYICFEFNQSASLAPDIIAFHGVYCRRSTHYVRVTISRFLGHTSTIQRIDEEEELTFEEFLKTDFTSTERYTETVKRVEEFDRQCCRPIYDTITFSSKKLVKRLLSCFSCIPLPRQSRSSRWPSTRHMRSTLLGPSTKDITANSWQCLATDGPKSIASQPRTPETRLNSPHPSIEATSANNRQDPVADDPVSIARNSLPENVSGVIAVDSFYSTPNGVRGDKVLVATQPDTIILLEQVNLDTLLRYTRITNQLREIVGDYAYEELREYEEKRMDISDPVYQGILPDDLPIRAGEEIRLEDCSPMLEAQVRSILDS